MMCLGVGGRGEVLMRCGWLRIVELKMDWKSWCVGNGGMVRGILGG